MLPTTITSLLVHCSPLVVFLALNAAKMVAATMKNGGAPKSEHWHEVQVPGLPRMWSVCVPLGRKNCFFSHIASFFEKAFDFVLQCNRSANFCTHFHPADFHPFLCETTFSSSKTFLGRTFFLAFLFYSPNLFPSNCFSNQSLFSPFVPFCHSSMEHHYE